MILAPAEAVKNLRSAVALPNPDRKELRKRIAVGRGAQPADLVLKNTKALDVFSGTWIAGDIALADGVIAGVGECYEGRETVEIARKIFSVAKI